MCMYIHIYTFGGWQMMFALCDKKSHPHLAQEYTSVLIFIEILIVSFSKYSLMVEKDSKNHRV